MKAGWELPATLAGVAGALTVFAFAPFGMPLLALVTLAVLMLMWQRAPGAWAAARVGYAFGLGLFGAGASWVYVALQPGVRREPPRDPRFSL